MTREKKSSIVMLRITPTLQRRLARAERKSGLGRQEIIRMGADVEIKRIMLDLADVPPAVVRAVSEARAAGVDPVAALAAAAQTVLRAAS